MVKNIFVPAFFYYMQMCDYTFSTYLCGKRSSEAVVLSGLFVLSNNNGLLREFSFLISVFCCLSKIRFTFYWACKSLVYHISRLFSLPCFRIRFCFPCTGKYICLAATTTRHGFVNIFFAFSNVQVNIGF